MTGLVTAKEWLAPTGRGRGTITTDLDLHEQHGGPFYLGYMHWRLYPQLAEGCGVVLGPRGDALAVGFRNGTNHIVQYGFAREQHTSPLASWPSSTCSARCSSGWRASARRPGCRPP